MGRPMTGSVDPAPRVALILALAACPCLAWAAAPPPAAPSPSVPPISAAEARQALDVLTDPARRTQVVGTLEAIVRAEAAHPARQPGTPAATAVPAPSIPTSSTPTAAPAAKQPAVRIDPNSLGAAVLLGVPGFLATLWNRTAAAARTAQSLPLLWGWLVVMGTDPRAQSILRQAIWRVALACGAGLAAEFAVRRLLRRPVSVLARRGPAGTGAPDRAATIPAGAAAPEAIADEMDADEAGADGGLAGEARAEAGEVEAPRRRGHTALALLRRLPLVFARLLLDLVPVLGFAVVGHVVAESDIGATEQSRLVMLAMVDAYVISAGVMVFVRMMLSPDGQRLRLLRVSDATALWATRWVRRLTVVTVFGYAIAEVGVALGMSMPAHDGLLKICGLIIHVFLGVMVLQKRRAVTIWMRPPAGATGPLARIRNALAPVWHWIALFFLVAIWIAWAIEVPNGFTQILRVFVIVMVDLMLARIASIVLLGALERVGRVRPDLAERYPGLEARLTFYRPTVQAAARAIVYAGAGVLMLEMSGLPLFSWFAISFLGQRLVAGLLTLGLTVVLAVVVWETANGALEMHLARLSREQQAARSARLRTLLPLLRSTLLVAIVVIAGLTVLSEIGINIAPLLAGAGIVGVAIGFGSQKLVQDLITGIFLLLENAMQVGDWVTVSSLSGTVEALSVRTIRLRASDGSVHIIPFSSVTSVTNTNRGIGNAAVSVTVPYSEDTDRVSAILLDLGAGMRADPAFASKMLSDLQLWGVDKVDGAGATLTGQFVCTDAGRWPVQREFNRRLKKRFEEEGVEIYNPARTVVVPVPARSSRPALASAHAGAAMAGAETAGANGAREEATP